MSTEQYANTAETTLTSAMAADDLTAAVTSRTAFPAAAQFRIRIDDELMIVTAGAGTGAGSFTVTRGAESTTAVAHANGATVTQVLTAAGLLNIAGRLKLDDLA